MDISLILLTYKGKILLTNKDYPDHSVEKSAWCFISEHKKTNSSPKDTILKKVIEETAISLNAIKFLSSCKYKNKIRHFFYGTLTDDNVNNIKRPEGKLINFFSIKELGNLSLTVSSQLLIEKHRDLLDSPLV
ncbi:NUDIX hydrolase [Patescibacteria group bacterium]|nr:NUDIX hydrolase [Patescibacteria group bacterium]